MRATFCLQAPLGCAHCFFSVSRQQDKKREKSILLALPPLPFLLVDMDINQEVLRKQIMVNQFCNQVGCTTEQATEILQKARWQIEVRTLD